MTITYRGKVAACLLANLLVLLYLAATSDANLWGALVACGGFWLCLLVVNPFTEYAYSAGNFHIVLFALTMIVGSMVMPFDDAATRFWSFRENWRAAHEIMPEVSLLWVVGFAFYLIGYYGKRWRTRALRRADSRAEERPGLWMLFVGSLLFIAGPVALTMLVGSLGKAVALGGTREGAKQLQAGAFRYLLWMEGAPVGASLLWYYLFKRYRMGRVGGVTLIALLYVPLIPFYLYSAGRARTLLPLLLLVSLYHRYCVAFRLRWLIMACVISLPLLSAWAQYRVGLRAQLNNQQGIVQVVAADLSRYDVSAIAIAGAERGDLAPLWGETIIAALDHALPVDIFPKAVGGTEAMGRALSSGRSSGYMSSYATPWLVEGYLNFGVPGICFFMFGLGIVVAVLDTVATRHGVIGYLFALSAGLKMPFGVSLEIALARLIWVVGVPFLIAIIIRRNLQTSQGVRPLPQAE